MAWRNIWRNTRRTLLTLGAIAFACLLLVFIMSFQFGGYETMINSSVKIHTGHLQIQADGFHKKQNIRRDIARPGQVGAVLDKIPAVEAYTVRGQAFSILSSGERSQSGLVIGVDPAREAKVSNLKKIIIKGDYFSPGDRGQALIGVNLAAKLKVGLGDEVIMLGQARDGRIAAALAHVKGIYRSGLDAFDRATIHLPLADFQEAYIMGDAVHRVVINVASLGQVEPVLAALKKPLAELDRKPPLVALTWDKLLPGLKESIQMDLFGAVVVYFILIVVVACGVLNAFMMVVFERTREFGVLRALGVGPNRLTRVLLAESLMIILLGAVAGVLLGAGATLVFQMIGIDLTGQNELLSQYGISGRFYPRLSALSGLSGRRPWSSSPSWSVFSRPGGSGGSSRLGPWGGAEMQMLDWQLAWRNVWRHPRRTTVIGAAVFIGVWAMVFVGAFIKGMENDMIASNLAALTGHIQIHAPGYLADPAVGQSMTDPAALAAALKKALPPGARWAWRVRVDAVASNARHMGGLTLVGVQPNREAGVSFLKPDLIQGGFLVPKDDRGIIIGAALLDEYEAKVGHKIILTGQATDDELVARAFHIIGLYRAPLQAVEKQFGFVSLDAAQRMLKLGPAVSEVSIVLPDRNDSAAVAEKLRRLLPEDKYSVKTWVQLKPVLQAYLLIFQSFTMVWYLVHVRGHGLWGGQHRPDGRLRKNEGVRPVKSPGHEAGPDDPGRPDRSVHPPPARFGGRQPGRLADRRPPG